MEQDNTVYKFSIKLPFSQVKDKTNQGKQKQISNNKILVIYLSKQ